MVDQGSQLASFHTSEARPTEQRYRSQLDVTDSIYWKDWKIEHNTFMPSREYFQKYSESIENISEFTRYTPSYFL
ncbi:hypothetical protein BLOT_003204 [Blomia tropicalis]|nr:hypothetical protein BLOT_003204 [Blomia tropicalis]